MRSRLLLKLSDLAGRLLAIHGKLPLALEKLFATLAIKNDAVFGPV